MEASEAARLAREKAAADADTALLQLDKQFSTVMLQTMRQAGDLPPATTKQLERPPVEPNISLARELHFSLLDLPPVPVDRDMQAAGRARQKRKQKHENIFTIDLSMAKQVVVLHGHGLGVPGAVSLAAELSIGCCPRLQVLDLSRSVMTSKGLGCLLRGIKGGNMLNLDTLLLRGNAIGPRGIEFLMHALESKAMDTLKLIDLRENELGDEGASILAHAILLGSLRNVQTLYLQRNGITDVGFKKIASVVISIHENVCPLLDRICLNENHVTSSCKRSLRPLPYYIVA